MSTPQPPSIPPPTSPERASFARATHTLSLGLLIVCPILIILPPRKLDLYTFSLSTAWLLSANHVVTERSGRGILVNLGDTRWTRGGREDGLPSAKAPEVQQRLRRENSLRQEQAGADGRVLAELEARRGRGVQQREEGGGEEEEEEEGGIKGMGKRLWMGGEREGWKERRLREEREALEEGRGYGGLIWDQIWEVWNWEKGRKGKDGDGEVDGE